MFEYTGAKEWNKLPFKNIHIPVIINSGSKQIAKKAKLSLETLGYVTHLLPAPGCFHLIVCKLCI